jgi:predicted RNA-binding protein with PUA-like domain
MVRSKTPSKSQPKPKLKSAPAAPARRTSGAAVRSSARSTAVASRRYWLFKSEPDVYGWNQLLADRRTFWHGVRNYQARNLLRDSIQVGDGVLFYHSNADPMAIVGIAKVVRAGYPDHTAWDASSDYYDSAATPDTPIWFMVDIEPVASLSAPLTRETLKDVQALQDMMLLQRGSRLSVQPVTALEWQAILALAGVKQSW